MSDLPQSSRSGVPGTLRPDVRAVVALSDSEQATFLGGRTGERLRTLLPGARWANPSNMTNAGWLRLLEDVRPEILVSCWKTPTLPAEIEGLGYVAHLVGSIRKLVPRSLMVAGLRATNWGGIAAADRGRAGAASPPRHAPQPAALGRVRHGNGNA